MWWPTFHGGLHEYYRQHGHRIRQSELPSSYIKYHPVEGWGRPPEPVDPERHLNLSVYPDMTLIQQSDDEIHQRLLGEASLFTEHAAGATTQERRVPAGLPVFDAPEFNLNRNLPVTSRDQASLKDWDVTVCWQEMTKALEEYKDRRSHHYQDRFQCAGQASGTGQEDMPLVPPGSEPLDLDSELTSDEESLQKRTDRQWEWVEQIEQQMWRRITRDRRQYNWPQLYTETWNDAQDQIRQLAPASRARVRPDANLQAPKRRKTNSGWRRSRILKG